MVGRTTRADVICYRQSTESMEGKKAKDGVGVVEVCQRTSTGGGMRGMGAGQACIYARRSQRASCNEQWENACVYVVVQQMDDGTQKWDG